MRKYLTNQITKLLTQLKESEGTTFEKIALDSDLGKSHLSNVINGRDNLSIEALDNIAKAHNKKVKIEFVDDIS